MTISGLNQQFIAISTCNSVFLLIPYRNPPFRKVKKSSCLRVKGAEVRAYTQACFSSYFPRLTSKIKEGSMKTLSCWRGHCQKKIYIFVQFSFKHHFRYFIGLELLRDFGKMFSGFILVWLKPLFLLDLANKPFLSMN